MRRSSYGGEESEESDVDQSPTMPRRGRRQAIFDSKVRLTPALYMGRSDVTLYDLYAVGQHGVLCEVT